MNGINPFAYVLNPIVVPVSNFIVGGLLCFGQQSVICLEKILHLTVRQPVICTRTCPRRHMVARGQSRQESNSRLRARGTVIGDATKAGAWRVRKRSPPPPRSFRFLLALSRTSRPLSCHVRRETPRNATNTYTPRHAAASMADVARTPQTRRMQSRVTPACGVRCRSAGTDRWVSWEGEHAKARFESGEGLGGRVISGRCGWQPRF